MASRVLPPPFRIRLHPLHPSSGRRTHALSLLAAWVRRPSCEKLRSPAPVAYSFVSAFYVACGLQDHLLGANRSIAAALREAGADVTYEEGEGIHDWVFWDAYFQHVLKWLDVHVDGKEHGAL